MRAFRAIALLSLSLLAASPACAAVASFVVTPTGGSSSIPANNNFQADLQAMFGGAGNAVVAPGATLALDAPGTVQFTLYGSEAAWTNGFYVNGIQTASTVPSAPYGVYYSAPGNDAGQQDYSAGAITNLAFQVLSGGTGTATIGQNPGFAIIYNSADPGSRVALAFDDGGGAPDADYDDMVVIAQVVPEPTVWALMIAAFGLLGLRMRRRRTVETAA